MRNFKIHFDGSCGPKNPGGLAAYGSVVEQYGTFTRDIKVICEESGVIGSGPKMSNNVAEFYALLIGLRRYVQYGVKIDDTVTVRGDSNLVIQVMSGNWKPKSDKLYYETYILVKSEVDFLNKMGVRFDFIWIPRELNTRCDVLSKEHNAK